MIEVFFAASQNPREGILVGAKLIGAILLSVIVLFLLLKLIRIAANLINRALYKRYLSKLNEDAPKMTFEEYLMSISGVKVFDKPTVAEESELKDNVSVADVKESDFFISDYDMKESDYDMKESDSGMKDSGSGIKDKPFNEPSAAEEHEVCGADTSDTCTKNTDKDTDNTD